MDGDDIIYNIDWGDGPPMRTSAVPSGSVVVATHTWTQARQEPYHIKVQAIELLRGTTTEVSSPWSPDFNFLIANRIVTRLDGIPLIGARAGVSQSTFTLAGTFGEWATGKSASTSFIAKLGYQGPISATSDWWALRLGAQGPGGAEASPPNKLAIADFVYLDGYSPQDVSQIALGLRQNGYAQLKDANGNQVLGGNRWIRFDYENRPARFITPDGATTDFAYDFEGNRANKLITNPDQSTFSSNYVGQIYEDNDSDKIQYITAGSLRVAMRNSSGVLYYLPDHLGSTHLITDPSQSTVHTNQYMPFGSMYAATGTQDSDYKFTGQRLDDSTGLYYYGARYYDPIFARFITPDTIIQSPYDPQTLNRYAYCRNNPVIYTDPSGHFFLDAVSDFFVDIFHMKQGDESLTNFFNENHINVNGNASASSKFGGGDNRTGHKFGGDNGSGDQGQNRLSGSTDPQAWVSLLGLGGMGTVGTSDDTKGLRTNQVLASLDPSVMEPDNNPPGTDAPGPQDYARYYSNRAREAIEQSLAGAKITSGFDLGYGPINHYFYVGEQRGKGFIHGVDAALTTSLVGADLNATIGSTSYGSTLTTMFGLSKYTSIGVTQDLSGRGGIHGFVGISYSVGIGVGLPGVNWSYGENSSNGQKR